MTAHNDTESARTLEAYEAPRALRMGQTREGQGGGVPRCLAPGSGAAGACSNGTAADPDCYQAGSSAQYCTEQGSGAYGCNGPGSGANEFPNP